jgi:putative Holliday junction resolvase
MEETSDIRLLGLDVGTDRIGVALSDGLGLTAQPLISLAVRGRDPLPLLVDLCREHDVSVVVVGLPLSLGGGDGGAGARRARRLGERLAEAAGVEVVYRDERFTTAEAERVLIGAGVRRDKRRQVVDKLAASLILQGYLDGRANEAS